MVMLVTDLHMLGLNRSLKLAFKTGQKQKHTQTHDLV